MTKASKGDVCSVSPCPASNAKSVRLPPDVFERMRLAIPPSVGVISELSGNAWPDAIIWLIAGPAQLRLDVDGCRFTNVESSTARRSTGAQANDEDDQCHRTRCKYRVAEDPQ